MTTLVRKISLSLKLVLAFLFGVLLIGEYIDGVNDISDWATLFFFVLMANDAFVHFRSATGNPLKSWIVSGRSHLSNEDKNKKLLINLMFLALLFFSVLIEVSNLSMETRDAIFKMGVIAWAGTFLGINIYNLISSFNYRRLIVTNIALILLIGSFALI